MKSTIPAPAAQLLDFIARFESRGNYLAYFGHGGNLSPLPATLGALIEWQHQLVAKGARSSAAGRYQFMPKTLAAVAKQYSIPMTEAFTSDLQDELGFYLMVGRGYDQWRAKTLSDNAFADNLSKEWASLPFNTGKSYYDGDGLNHALCSRNEFMAAIVKAKNATAQVAQPKEPSMNTTQHSPVDFVAGLTNMAENAIAQIESAIKVGVSPNNSVTVTPQSGNAMSVFSSISNAQLAITELGTVIADARAGKWQNEPSDIIAFLKTLFLILSTFGVVVPGLTQIVEMLPDLQKVEPPNGAVA